jgi:repressor LexA
MDGGPQRRGRRPISELTETQLRVLREVRDFIEQRGIPPTAKELADLLGVSPATAHEQVGQLVRKGYVRREPRKARGIFLIREPDVAPTDLVSIPLVGTVPAGVPLLAEENVFGEVMVERKLVASSRCFALRIQGESMRDASINDGDVVIVRQQPVAQNGDIVVAVIDDDATVKRLSIREDAIELRPENPEFSPIRIGPDHEMRIVGKVIAVRRGGGLSNA